MALMRIYNDVFIGQNILQKTAAEIMICVFVLLYLF